MSRVGKSPVAIPSGVEFSFNDNVASAKGKLGTLTRKISPLVKVSVEDNVITVAPQNESKEARMLWGTERKNLFNLVQGVHEGFEKKLELVGVGYRAAVQGKELVMQLGFSHEVRYKIPEGIETKVEKNTNVTISGADRQKVGQMAAEIRSYRKPEPYKGKGVRYAGEYIFRKEGKKK